MKFPLISTEQVPREGGEPPHGVGEHPIHSGMYSIKHKYLISLLSQIQILNVYNYIFLFFFHKFQDGDI